MKKEKPVKKGQLPQVDYALLHSIVDRAYYYALKMIDIANHGRPVPDKGEPKVGGHPSACASSKHILAAIHLVLRNPEDYMACKPHVSPMDHAYNYLLGNFRNTDGSRMDSPTKKLAMKHLRHYSFSGDPVFQSYHADSDPDSFRYFPSGSVGIPPVNALYTALGYHLAKDHGHQIDEDPTFWCLMGDSEFREGSLMEAMPDAADRELGRLVWIVDYNRQNLDGTRITNEKAMGGSDGDRILRVAAANGWHTIRVQHGKFRRQLFAKPGGDEFQKLLEHGITDFEFQALLGVQNAGLIRERFIEKSPGLKKFLKNLDDNELLRAFNDLGGHCIETLAEALLEAKSITDKPTLVLPYTIKGHGLRCQAMSGNHSALPDEDELIEMAKKLGLPENDPFQEYEPDSDEGKYLAERGRELVDGIDKIRKQSDERLAIWRKIAQSIDWPTDFDITAIKFNPVAHTQWMWGQIAAKMDRLARGQSQEDDRKGSSTKPQTAFTPNEEAWKKIAPLFLTMAPDVGSSTNTSPNMNGKLYGDIEQEDFEKLFGSKDQKAPDVMPHASKRSGHLRFEIAEGNCMSAAGSLGKFSKFVGIPFFPAMTIYDFFIKRALDQFYYNLYWHCEFATLGTPSGITLSSEGAQHSWKSDIQIPNCITWEPFYTKELEWILAETFKRHFTGDNSGRESALIRCVTRGIPQKEMLDRLKAHTRFKSSLEGPLTVENQSQFTALSDGDILEATRSDALNGGYALVDYRGYQDYSPGDNVVHLFAMGALGLDALRASDSLLKEGIYANVFIVTSPDLLLGNFAYENQYEHLKSGLGITGDIYLSEGREVRSAADWFALQGGRIPVVSVHDGEPGLLDNIGSIVGVKHRALAVRKTSKSGTIADIYKLHHLDPQSIIDACKDALAETANERFQINHKLESSILGGLSSERGSKEARLYQDS